MIIVYRINKVYGKNNANYEQTIELIYKVNADFFILNINYLIA